MNQMTEQARQLWAEIVKDPVSGRTKLNQIVDLARQNPAPCTIQFGTSGWRGMIGVDYTIRNVKIAAAAIVETYRTAGPELLKALGVAGYTEFQHKGVIVGHDNRLMGPEFARAVIGVFQACGVKCLYAGEAATPEFAAALELGQACCAVNLTPSHNPSPWAGFKFNPADGGPAGPEITTRIDALAAFLMRDPPPWATASPAGAPAVDLAALYRLYLKERGTIDLPLIQRFLHDEDVLLVIDHVHGATRGRFDALLGSPRKVQYLRTDDDKLFGGVAPEPSEKNLAQVTRILQTHAAKYKIGAILDPDGDRVRLTDGHTQIEMNFFGALALHYLHVHRKFSGCVVKSLPTSNFVNAVAQGIGVPLEETPVGFKNFRPWMRTNAPTRAIVAFEESDGISGYRNTLEKDAFFGLLLAIEMVARTHQNLGDYLADLQRQFGTFHTRRAGLELDRDMVGEKLLAKLATIPHSYPVGSQVPIGDRTKTVAQVRTDDGTKLVFSDKSWLMIRPSGTEPKVRFYVETLAPGELDGMLQQAQAMTRQAIEGR